MCYSQTINEARKQADLLLVSLHGGHKYDPYPSLRMVKVFRASAEAGAPALWNSHAHCPEGFEVRCGVPIIYCPDNFYLPARSFVLYTSGTESAERKGKR